jgi:hypothetical protein
MVLQKEEIKTIENIFEPRPTKKRFKSIVAIFTGSRGSGKTVSAAIQCYIDMVKKGRTVWSNLPIEFTADGKHYEALPLNMASLYTFDKELNNGVVFIDELPLWFSNQDTQAVTTKLFAKILTLIRKRGLSFYFTSQDYSWAPTKVRFQIDAWISCFDLSFKYQKLEEGSMISQLIRDMSGVFTGYSYEYADDYMKSRCEKRRTVQAKRFWNIIDTLNEFNPLEASKKLEIRQEKSILFTDSSGVSYIEENKKGYDEFMRENLTADIESVIERERFKGSDFIKSADMLKMLKEIGHEVDIRYLGRILPEFGLKYKHKAAGESGYFI